MSGFFGSCETLRYRCLSFSMLIVALLAASGVHAQTSPVGGQVTTPGSSIEKPEDSGVRAHTNIEIFRPGTPPAGAGFGVSQPSVTARAHRSRRQQRCLEDCRPVTNH